MTSLKFSKEKHIGSQLLNALFVKHLISSISMEAVFSNLAENGTILEIVLLVTLDSDLNQKYKRLNVS